MNEKRTIKLLKEVEKIAIDEHDGHYTILRFTTNWKGAFGTPNLRCADINDCNKVKNFPGYYDLEQLLENMVKYKFFF